VAICDARWLVRWHPLWEGNPVIATPREVAGGEPVHKIQNAVNVRPYLQKGFTHASGWRFTDWRAQDHRGKIYLSLKERALGIAAQQQHGPFVVIEPSPIAKSNPNKAWPREKFAGLIAACPDVRFAQIHHPESTTLDGAVQLGASTFRNACGILASAAAYVGPEGGLHHAAAALGVPAVVIFGGCASVKTTGYPEHVNLADDGPQTPCGRWVRCGHCVDAMAKITPERVANALREVMVRPAGAGTVPHVGPPVVIQTIPSGAAEELRE
jgi:ADP-heptose:LPS heptosyltransferase